MENLRTFQCNGFKFHISDSGCWVESPDGEVKEYENRREAILVFVKSISYPINEIEKKAIASNRRIRIQQVHRRKKERSAQ